MGELVDAITARFRKEQSDSAQNEAKVKLKNQVSQMADELLKDPDSALLFEVSENFIPFVEVFFEDPDLTEFYIIQQAPGSTSEFIIKVRELVL